MQCYNTSAAVLEYLSLLSKASSIFPNEFHLTIKLIAFLFQRGKIYTQYNSLTSQTIYQSYLNYYNGMKCYPWHNTKEKLFPDKLEKSFNAIKFA